MTQGDPDPETAAYHRGREIEELAAAAESSCMVRSAHIELAELHAEAASSIDADAGDESKQSGATDEHLDIG